MHMQQGITISFNQSHDSELFYSRMSDIANGSSIILQC